MPKLTLIVLVQLLFALNIFGQEPEAGTDQDVCADSTMMNANNPPQGATGYWSLMSGGAEIVNPTLCTTKVRQLAPGENVFRWSFNDMSDYVSIFYRYVEADAGDDQVIEWPNIETYMGAQLQEGASGIWSVISGAGVFDDNTDPSALVTNFTEGENTYLWTVEKDDCVATDIVTVFHYNCFAGTDMTYCAEPVYLTAYSSGGAEQYWQVVSGSGIFEDPTNPNTTVSGLSQGENTFRWTVNYDGYVCTDNVVVTYTAFDVDAGNDTVVSKNVAQLNAMQPEAGAGGQWEVCSGSGQIENYTLYNTWVNNLSVGNNTFRWTVEKAGCFFCDMVTVTYDPTAIDGIADESGFTLYPVPAANVLHISFPQKGNFYTEIYSTEGRLLHSDMFRNQKQASTDISALKSGVYFCRITGEEKQYSKMFVVSK